MDADVPQCPGVVTIAEHCEGLVAECREGREPADQTDQCEGPELRPEHLPVLREPDDRANPETTQEIHDRGAVRKCREGKPCLHDTGESITSKSSEESPRTDDECIDEGQLQLLSARHAGKGN